MGSRACRSMSGCGTLPANPRNGNPAEIAALIGYLVSEEATFLNGSVIVADGGWTAP